MLSNQFQDSSPASVPSSQGAQLTSKNLTSKNSNSVPSSPGAQLTGMNLTIKNSSSVPSSPGAQEPDVTASQAKMSKPEIITLVAFAVMTIAIYWLLPAKGRYSLDVDAMALMIPVIIMSVSGIIHNKIKMVTGVTIIVLAVLTIIGLALAHSGILHF